MQHYTSVTQTTTLKAQTAPQGVSVLHNRPRQPSNVYVPMKQHQLQERISRECVQVLESVLPFKCAMSQISKSVTRFAQAVKEQKDVEENLYYIFTSTAMPDRIIESLEVSLDTLLNQNMSLACNLS